MAVISGGALPPKLAGSSFDGMIHVADWYPTLCRLADVDPTDNPKSDAPADWFWPVDVSTHVDYSQI
jgi:arylsulfatase B